jgi:hypothetical protein
MSKKYPDRKIRKNSITFAKFKQEWKKEFGEPSDQREKSFINGKRGDYQRIWGFYDDYRTGNDSIKKYLKDIQK